LRRSLMQEESGTQERRKETEIILRWLRKTNRSRDRWPRSWRSEATTALARKILSC